MVKKSKIARTGVTLIEYFLIALLVGAVAFGLTPVFKNANKYMETHRAQQNKGSFNKEGSFMSWFKPGKGEQGVSPLDPGGGLGPSDEINFTFNCGTVNMTAEEAKCGVIPGACGILTDGCWICNADIQMWQWATNKNTCRDYWFGNIKETCLAKCVDLTTPDYLPPIYGDGTTRNYCYICANSGDSIGYWYRMKSGSGTACDSFWNNPHSCFGSDTSFAVPCGSCTGLPPLSGYYHEKTKNGGDSCWICDGNQWINTNVGSVCMQAWVNEPATCPDLNDLIADTDYPYCGCSAPPPARGQNGITVGTDKCWICRNNTWERESDSTKCQEFWIDNKCEGYTPPLPLPCNGATTTPTSPALGAGNCWLCTNPSEAYRQNPIDKDPLYLLGRPCNIYWIDEEYPHFLDIPGEPDDLDTVCSAPFSSLGSAEPGIAQDPVSGKWGCWACNENNYKTWARIEWNGDRFVNVASPEYQACHSFWMDGVYPNSYPLPSPLEGKTYGWGNNDYGQIGDGTEVAKINGPVDIGKNLTDIAKGAYHTCGLDAAGKVWCWGVNRYGQFGNGKYGINEKSSVPVQGPTSHTFWKIAAGGNTTCAIDTLSRAWCWGDDSYWNTGSDEPSGYSFRPTPVEVHGGRKYVDITVSEKHTCAIDTVGRAWCWGYNDAGQLGNTSVTESRIPVKVEGSYVFKKISANGDPFHSAHVAQTCAIDTAGRAWCWGNNAFGQLGNNNKGVNSPVPVQVDYAGTFKDISVGREYTCAINSSDKILCWGGGVGTGNSNYYAKPTISIAGTYKSVSSANIHTCAISLTGDGYCWGWNNTGQLGDGTQSDSEAPVKVLGGPYAKIITNSSESTSALGEFTHAQPPPPPPPDPPPCNGSTSPSGTPSAGNCWLCTNPSESYRQNPIDGSPLYSLYDKPCNIYWADEDYPPFLNIPGDPDDLDTVCSASFSSLGSADPGIAQDPSSGKWGCWACNENNSKTWQRIEWDGDRFVNVASPEYQACHSFWMEGTYPNSYPLGGGGSGGGGGGSGTVEDPNLDVGSAVAWGYNSVGQLGDGTTVNRNIPVTILGEHTFKQVSAGYNHTCALDTTGKALCWGDNYFGALGNGTTDNSSVLVEVSSSRDFKQISAGDYHTCALDTSGKVWCWGDNRWGQLGNGTTDSSPSPVMVSASSVFKEISVGYYHTCALDTTGKAWCWGYNEDGQLGNKNTVDSSVPVIVSTEVIFKHITAGCHHTCALDTTDTTWCWGSNEHGQLGINTPSVNNSTTPVKVTVGGFKQISSGYGHICALDADGKIWCWGLFDPDSQLAFTLPAKLALNNSLNFKQISAGYEHTCVLDTDDKAWCWGSNSSGQLGNGTTDNSSVLVEVSGSYTFSQISAGGNFTVAIARDPSGPTMPTLPADTYSWGENNYGQLGDNSQINRLSPVPIGKTFIDVAPGHTHTCALDEEGKAWCWGSNSDGQAGVRAPGIEGMLGSPDFGAMPLVPTTIGSVSYHTFKKIATGNFLSYHTCAIDTDDAAWCWGRNMWDALGGGSSYTSYNWYCNPVPVTGGLLFKDIVVWTQSTFALDTDGKVWSWGQGSGETPVEISGEHTFTQIAIGYNKLHGIDTAGDIWEWKNSSTLVKVDKSLASPAPITVPFVQVTGSVYHVCALDSTGKAWCWKDNRDGALGIGTIGYFDFYNAPQAVLGGLTFKELTAGSTFTCGLTLAGDAYCWGSNLHGELGNNQVTGTDSVLSPTKVDGGPYKTIKAGGTFVIGIVE